MADSPGNALARSTSPYLRQHAENPVAWQEWGEAAFTRAQEEDKPIFLSIGYSTCHWCHVMAAESFADPGIAALLNADFVAIKVDREQRPDIDQVYMTFVQATTGSGGWPLTVWLTPAREPLVGATYLPRDRLAAALEDIARSWRADRDGLARQATALSERIAAHLAAPATGDPAAPDRTLLAATEAALAADYDATHGGFGGAPKFPRPSELDFLFAVAGDDPDCRAAEMACATLAAIVHGGIHDHLGGGFHRYSVDARWRLPHFEKMLYDQGQLLGALCAAHRLRPDPLWDGAIRATVAYVRDRLRHPDGAFHAAEDADSPTASGAHREGAYYLWSHAELHELLGDDAAAFCLRYGVEPGGNITPAQDPHGELRGLNVLHHAREATAVAAELGREPDAVLARLGVAEARCEQARRSRPPPHRDAKIITAWNGLMISGLVDAAMLLDEEGWLADARRAAAFIDTHLRDGERLWRCWSDGHTTGRGVAVDYAALARARLDLFLATGNPGDLEATRALLRGLDSGFADPATGGWFDSDREADDVLWRIRERHDGAEPAAASLAIDTLVRLHRITGDPTLGERVRQVLASHGTDLAASPRALPAFARALARALSDPGELVIVGAPRDPRTRALLKTAWAPPGPQPTIVPFHPGTAAGLRAGHPERAALDPAGEPVARLCRGHTCLAPTGDPDHLRELLAGAR